jgi:hypothetical protein
MSVVSNIDGVFEAALEVAKNRCVLMNALRAALDGKDDQTALRLARQLVGINEQQVEPSEAH